MVTRRKSIALDGRAPHVKMTLPPSEDGVENDKPIRNGSNPPVETPAKISSNGTSSSSSSTPTTHENSVETTKSNTVYIYIRPNS